MDDGNSSISGDDVSRFGIRDHRRILKRSKNVLVCENSAFDVTYYVA